MNDWSIYLSTLSMRGVRMRNGNSGKYMIGVLRFKCTLIPREMYRSQKNLGI